LRTIWLHAEYNRLDEGNVMSAGVTTVIAAALAVFGTLLSPVLAQRITARAKQQEFELAQRQNQDERVAEDQRLAFVERRAAYTDLNAQMRAMHRALLNHMHLIRAGSQTEADIAELDEARHKYLERYFDVQMLISDDVLRSAGYANDVLGRAYGMARRRWQAGMDVQIRIMGGMTETWLR
jgi:hypothetical protein